MLKTMGNSCFGSVARWKVRGDPSWKVQVNREVIVGCFRIQQVRMNSNSGSRNLVLGMILNSHSDLNQASDYRMGRRH